MAMAEAGGPELPPEPGAPPAGPALDDPEAMHRLRATFVDSIDGWLDDNIAFAMPWGFELQSIAASVSLRFGSRDERARAHARVLHDLIPGSVVHEDEGGHIQGEAALRDLLSWCVGA